MKYYIIQEAGFEYNDEIYNKTDGGTPVKVFKDRIAAELAADGLNKKKLENESLGTYAYSLDDVTDNIDELLVIMTELIPTITKEQLEEDCHEIALPTMTDEQYKKLKRVLKLNFFQVIECDGE